MKERLHAAKQDWEVWTDWYEDRLEGCVRDEERELAYVHIDDDLWNQGPAIVNDEIKRQIEEHRPLVAALTEAERLVVQRIGQDVFRKSLIDYWGGRCPITGIDRENSCVPATSRLGPIARPMPSASMSSTAFCSLLISTPPSTRP